VTRRAAQTAKAKQFELCCKALGPDPMFSFHHDKHTASQMHAFADGETQLDAEPEASGHAALANAALQICADFRG